MALIVAAVVDEEQIMTYRTEIKLTTAPDLSGVFIKVVGEDGTVFDDGFIQARPDVPFAVWYDDLNDVMERAVKKIGGGRQAGKP
jgi:hypothetical protein